MRCPECGAPFDPNDPTTYFSLARRRTSWGAIWLSSLLSGWVTAVVIYLIRSSEPVSSDSFKYLFFFVMCHGNILLVPIYLVLWSFLLPLLQTLWARWRVRRS